MSANVGGALSSSSVEMPGIIFRGEFLMVAIVSGEAQGLDLGSVVVGGCVWRRGRAFRSLCRRRLGALVRWR